MKTRFGIDVSNAQGSIEWPKVAPHVAFVFLKTSEGMTFNDPTYTVERVKAIRRAGIPFGPYHFARPDNNDGAAEARRFVQRARSCGWGKPGDLPGVLDIETGPEGRPSVRFVRRFAREYRKLTGHRVIVYTGSFWRDAMRNPVTLTRSRLWLAAYVTEYRPYVPRAWKRPVIWQFTDRANVPGVSGGVDGDTWLRSSRAFERMRIKRRIR